MDHTGTFKMVGDELEAFRRAPIFHLSMSAKVRARADITPGALQHQRAVAASTSSEQQKKRRPAEATGIGSDRDNNRIGCIRQQHQRAAAAEVATASGSVNEQRRPAAAKTGSERSVVR